MPMVYDNANILKMIYWNAHGISNYNRIKGFEYLIEKEYIHITSLIETHLNETLLPKT